MLKIIYKLFAYTQIAFMCCLLFSMHAYAEPKVGIIIPELRAPYNEIYDAISDGIDKGLQGTPERLLLEKDYSSEIITDWLSDQGIESIIALGSLGQKSTVYLPSNMSVVLGAVLSSSSEITEYPSIALIANPIEQFNLLKKLDSKRTKIVVVYNPSKNQWLIDLAKQQIEASKIQLIAYQATDIKQSARIYDEVLRTENLDTTALWIMQDRSVVDSRVVLPFILEKAWQKNVVVFSGSPGHVKNGVLFCLYPNNIEHGEQAANLLLKEIKGFPVEDKIYPTKGLQKAINSRTAEHLGLSITRSDLREFDLVFPLSN
ncbi:MAG: ABC transporter substrate binding protein [Pseudomonadota bacterium]